MVSSQTHRRIGPTIELIHHRLPEVGPDDEDTSESYGDESETLASRNLWIIAAR